ncbi:hypothetical protein N7454_004837 [Penicillium verhagenii]|nr:hypothetical protein N7454_004837 [Penicillium verhagenii]
MKDPIEFPFKASDYAFRTNFDGLEIAEKHFEPKLETDKQAFKNALKQFESKDSDAREDYKSAKDAGFTTDSFKEWVPQNAPQWNGARQLLVGCGASLTQTAQMAFGKPYIDKLEKDEKTFADAALQAGHWPDKL